MCVCMCTWSYVWVCVCLYGAVRSLQVCVSSDSSCGECISFQFRSLWGVIRPLTPLLERSRCTPAEYRAKSASQNSHGSTRPSIFPQNPSWAEANGEVILLICWFYFGWQPSSLTLRVRYNPTLTQICGHSVYTMIIQTRSEQGQNNTPSCALDREWMNEGKWMTERKRQKEINFPGDTLAVF